MLKLIVPIAHASNIAGSDHNIGFLATLCSANKTIVVQLDIPVNKENPSKANQAQEKCPLCVVAEQSDADASIVPTIKHFAKFTAVLSSNAAVVLTAYSDRLTPIRGPPTLL